MSSQTVAMMQIDEELAREELKHNVLVYDKGGGTFDGSLFASYGRSQITSVSGFVQPKIVSRPANVVSQDLQVTVSTSSQTWWRREWR